MPRVRPEVLREIGCELFVAAGCTPPDARTVVDHLVESNLFGHDSHGVIRYPDYVKAIRQGRYQAQADPEVLHETPCTAVVDAHGALGQIGARFATELAIEKARQQGVASVSLRNTCHIGRVGAYPLMAARAGTMAQVFANGGHFGGQVAPFGGIDGRLCTDPLAFAAPRREADPILLDMTTSVVAEGKVRVASYRGEEVPQGWLIDSEGHPTRDPKTFRADPPGSILPLGGVAAHKGYGMAFMVELLGGSLSGQGCTRGAPVVASNGVLLTVYHIESFTDLETYYDEVEALLRHVRSSRLAPGFDEILAPGEPEFRSARQRQSAGIEVDPKTWSMIREELQGFDIDPERWEPE